MKRMFVEIDESWIRIMKAGNVLDIKWLGVMNL